MNLILRMLRVLVAARFRSRVSALEETVVTFRVWLNDLDPLLHMNNGRYLTIMDLGRNDAYIRTGMSALVRQRGWFPVVASETIRFRQSLNPLQRYELRTRMLGWDDRSFYIGQTFVTTGGEAAVAIVRIRFLRRSGGTVNADEVAAALLPGVPSPPLPDYVATWRESESELTKAALTDR